MEATFYIEKDYQCSLIIIMVSRSPYSYDMLLSIIKQHISIYVGCITKFHYINIFITSVKQGSNAEIILKLFTQNEFWHIRRTFYYPFDAIHQST